MKYHINMRCCFIISTQPYKSAFLLPADFTLNFQCNPRYCVGFFSNCHSNFHFQTKDHSFERAHITYITPWSKGDVRSEGKPETFTHFPKLGWCLGHVRFQRQKKKIRERHCYFQDHYLKNSFIDQEEVHQSIGSSDQGTSLQEWVQRSHPHVQRPSR